MLKTESVRIIKNYIIVLSSNFIEQGVSINADIEDGYLCALKDI